MIAFVTIVFLCVAIPLFSGSTRLLLAGLAAQGVLLAALAYHLHGELTPAAIVLLADLGLVRAVGVPVYLTRAARGAEHLVENDLLPANLFHWGLALAIGLVGFGFARRIYPNDLAATAALGAATTQVLLGLLLLSVRASPFAQALGTLAIENGLSLFELHCGLHLPFAVQLGVAVVYAGIVILFGTTLRPGDIAPATPAPPRDAHHDEIATALAEEGEIL